MWRQPSLVAGERSILLRDQLGIRFFPDLLNWQLEAAFTGTLEAYLHEALDSAQITSDKTLVQ